MSPRFAYIYLMRDEPERFRPAVPEHVSHWRSLELAGYTGGPFEDRTGGLITFEAEDPDRAMRAVQGDPFVKRGMLDSYWLKHWVPE